MKVALRWEIPALPIAQGEKVGYIKVVDEKGETLHEAPLLALEEVKPTLWQKIKHYFAEHRLWRKVAFGGGILFILLLLLRKRSRKRY